MISKILKIQGLGKFKNFTNGGNDNLRFLGYTVIFGYNTHGKSTLTSIFRSLKLADQRYLQGKKNFDHSGNITIDILNDKNENLTLSNDSWNYPEIAIFDNHFIHNSVFVGDEIDYRHKSTLHGLFVGEDITPKLNRLRKLREEQDQLEKDRDKIKSEYARGDLGTFEGFFNAEFVDNVDKKILDKTEEIKRLRNIATLKELIARSPLASTFEKFSATMQKTLDTSAEKNIETHINEHWKDPRASRNFLADGVSLLNEETNTCAFCGQDLSSVSNLVADIKKVFGSTYKETQSEIENVGEAFLRVDFEAELAKFSALGVICENVLDKESLLKNKSALDRDVRIKLKNLNHPIDCESVDKPFKKFLAEIDKLRPTFQNINTQEFSSDKQRVLEQGLKQFELAQYRHSGEGCDLAKRYEKAVTRVENKKTEIDNLRKEIDEETKSAIEKNHEQIKKILSYTLKADFTVQKLSSRSNLNRPDAHFVEYEFAIDGHSVPLSNKRSQTDEEPLDKPYFGNTFSDSDRRLLAMAFFISSLQTDPKLNNKIVVLDDPFSSFDSNRKDYLAKAIISIQNANGDRPKQIIILTHDDGFLGRLQEKLPRTSTKILRIVNSKSNGSALRICEVDDLIEEEYFKDIKYIKDSIDNSCNVDEALGKVRKCLERILRHKYYFSLDNEALADGSISAYLKHIGDKCPVRKEILENNWHEHMHDQPQIMGLSEPEKIQKLKDFLTLLEKV